MKFEGRTQGVDRDGVLRADLERVVGDPAQAIRVERVLQDAVPSSREQGQHDSTAAPEQSITGCRPLTKRYTPVKLLEELAARRL